MKEEKMEELKSGLPKKILIVDDNRDSRELVVAAVVMQLGDELMSTQMITEPLLTEAQFSGLVLMAFITTLIAPLSLRWAVVRTCLPDERAAFCKLWKQGKDKGYGKILYLFRP